LPTKLANEATGSAFLSGLLETLPLSRRAVAVLRRHEPGRACLPCGALLTAMQRLGAATTRQALKGRE